jgi:hypothetical protein
MAFPTALTQLPNGTTEALDLIIRCDRNFLSGFANLEGDAREALTALQPIFQGTPLQQSLDTSIAALSQNEFSPQHFLALAAARTSLQGASFDALQQQIRDALGRTNPLPLPESEPTTPPEQVRVWQDSIQNWLVEIALTGFIRLETTTLTPFLATLEAIQAEPSMLRQAALLTGFFNELMSQVPITDSSQIPTYRWVDLWTQGMVRTLGSQPSFSPVLVSGHLQILGLDLRQHANLVSITAYGLLLADAIPQQVRVTFSAYKVDAISGDEIWLLFPDAATLLDAFAQSKTLSITAMPMLPTGDLLWNGQAEIGEKFDLMAQAAKYFAANGAEAFNPCAVHPCDRHPIQLAEPIFLQDYTTANDQNRLTLSWGEAGALPIATERLSPDAEVTRDAIATSSELFGLLRFDAGRWAVQPLTLKVGKSKLLYTGQTAAKLLKKPPSKNTVATLQERASRLLRK